VAVFGSSGAEPEALDALLAGLEQRRPGEATEEFCARQGCVNSLRGDDWKRLLPVPAEARVLELGGGYGRDAVDLARDAGELISLVPGPTNGRVVRRFADASGATNVRVAAVADLARLPLPDAAVQAMLFEDAAAGSFGLSSSMLHAAAAEWVRILAPGGKLLIGVGNPVFRTGLARRVKAGLGADPQRRSMNRRVKELRAPSANAGLRRGSTLRCFARSGLTLVEAYAPPPDEDNAEFLIPVGERPVVDYFLDYLVRKKSLAVRLATWSVKALLRCGLFAPAMPYHYLLFEKPPRSAGGS
jgi:SAM-dependent methyltransferase